MVEVHETVAVPAPLIVPGVIAWHVKPEGTVSVRLTIPLNPFKAAMVIVEVAEEPTWTEAGDEAVIVKSGGAVNVKVAVAV